MLFDLNALTDNDLLLGTRVKVTPWSYQVLLLDGQLQVLQPPQPVNPDRNVDEFLMGTSYLETKDDSLLHP